jgi:hypothetical protein
VVKREKAAARTPLEPLPGFFNGRIDVSDRVKPILPRIRSAAMKAAMRSATACTLASVLGCAFMPPILRKRASAHIPRCWRILFGSRAIAAALPPAIPSSSDDARGFVDAACVVAACEWPEQLADDREAKRCIGAGTRERVTQVVQADAVEPGGLLDGFPWALQIGAGRPC